MDSVITFCYNILSKKFHNNAFFLKTFFKGGPRNPYFHDAFDHDEILYAYRLCKINLWNDFVIKQFLKYTMHIFQFHSAFVAKWTLIARPIYRPPNCKQLMLKKLSANFFIYIEVLAPP